MELVDVSALIFQTINISIIVFVLWKFFFKPYLAFLDMEAKKRAKLEKDAEASAHIIDIANVEANKIRDEARIDAKNMASEIIENARKESEDILADASKEAELARQKAFSDIEYERKTLKEEMKQKVISVAVKMNEKLFGKNEANEQFLRNSQKDIHF